MEFKRKNRKLLNACSENLDVLGDDCSPAEESLSDYDGEGDDTVQDVEPVQALSEREPNSDNKHTSDDEAVDVPAVNNVGDKRSRIIEPSIPEVRVSTAEESHGTVNVPQGLIAESDAESSNYSTPVLERKDTERTQQDETQHSSDIIPKETEQGKDNHNNHSESDDKKHDNDGHRNKADGLPKQSTGLTEQEKRVVKEMVEEANAETMDASKYVPEVVQIQSPAHVASDAPIVPVHVERSPIGTKIYVVRQEDGEESRFDMRADRLIVKDVTPLAHESTDALPTPSNWGSLDKAKDKVSWLLRLFRSDFFEIWWAVYYLHLYPDAGVRDYLCNQLFSFPISQSEFYLPQLCRMAMQRHTVGDPVERFLMYQSARYIHFALLVVLDLETVIQDDNQPEVIHAYCVSLRERIVSQRAKFNERNGYSEPPTLGLRIVGVDSDSRKHTAATPSTGPTTHTPASAALGMRSTHFTQRQPSAVQSLSEDDLNVRPSATATTTASDRSGFGMTSKLRRTNLKYKKKKRPQHPPQATSLTEGVGTQGGSGDAVGTRSEEVVGKVTDPRNADTDAMEAISTAVQPSAITNAPTPATEIEHADTDTQPHSAAHTDARRQVNTSPHTHTAAATPTQADTPTNGTSIGEPTMCITPTPDNQNDGEMHRDGPEATAEDTKKIGTGGNGARSETDLTQVMGKRQGGLAPAQPSQGRNRSFPGMSKENQQQAKSHQSTQAKDVLYRMMENAESVNQHLNGIPGDLTLTYYLGPETSFLSALTNIGEELVPITTREMRGARLHAELTAINLNLPARVYMPLMVASDSRQHHIVRVPPTESVILNSKDRVPFMILIEVLECDDLLTSELPTKSFGVDQPSTPTATSTECRAFSPDGTDIASEFDRRSAEIEIKQEMHSQHPLSASALHNTMARSESVATDHSQLQFATSLPHSGALQVDESPLAKICSEPANKSDRSINRTADIYRTDHVRPPLVARSASVDMGDAMDVMICERFIPMKSQSVRRVILYDDVVKLKEPWEIKRERVRTASPYGHLRNWNVLSVIVKSGDDLRQDVLASQLLLQFELIWKTEKVDLWLRPVRAMITSNNSGIIETIHDAISIHSIKKHNNGSLYEYFVQEYGPVGCPRWNKAQYNFIQSMAAYSLVAYFLQIKDRHNGNIMLTRDGHLVHIDFGYFISSSPRNMGFESAPFKLTTEFVQVMGGVDSPGYRKFRDLLFIGFVTAKKHMENILVLVDIMQKGSDLPCFVAGLECRRLMKERFFHSETEHNLKLLVNGLVDRSLDAMSTVLYDNYQYYTNGIL